MSIIRKLGAGALAAALAVGTMAPTASAQLGPASAQGEYCTQGYYATLLVENMRADVRQTWTAENAIQFLKDKGIEPLEGWSADETLTQGDMVFLLRFVDIPIYTADPEREVTILEARSIMKKFERKFMDGMTKAMSNVAAFITVDGQTATTVDDYHLEHPLPPSQ